ncbi:site-specific integrase [Kibdelosporangium philippinense]|uniref:Site-specific integrase n=1 Tax=Kibdelosporangium philippinense TaxID=211113 RepID=A0ABS8ZIG6_9PSEU|nr:site-specific integrase [Kibdelosporangium philippinense]MCE7007352.1 site-specific integrase [Kibdelosporangium philippinense]
MIDDVGQSRDLAALAVPLVGSLQETGDPWLPFRLVDPSGEPVEAVSAFFRDLQAAGRSEATARSYGINLLRWFRFLWAVQVPWDRATRVEARDFCRWMLVAGKPPRPHWRRPGEAPKVSSTVDVYAPSVRAHSETVLRSFYEFHVDAGSGPLVNPFPLDRSRRGRRAHAHHNPMEPHRNERTGLYRPRLPARIPRSVPDEEFNEIFARLPSHRDRALVAFYVSTGARASELLSATQGGVDPGRQLITVVRKGSRVVQQLPASTDAFVWLRLYQVEMDGLILKGRRQPLWWTLRRPVCPLTYHAAHRMFERAADAAGSAATLHALRHTAAHRMAEDPALPLTDVQFVLGHALLTTTQIYLTPRKEEVIRRVLAHHAEQTRHAARRAAAPPAPWPNRCRCCSEPGRRDQQRRRGLERGCAVRSTAKAGPHDASRPSCGHGLAGHAAEPAGGLGAVVPATVRAGQPQQPVLPQERADPSVGMVGKPTRRHLAGPMAGQRRGHGREVLAADPGTMAPRPRSSDRMEAGRGVGRGTGGDQRRHRPPFVGLAAHQRHPPGFPGRWHVAVPGSGGLRRAASVV